MGPFGKAHPVARCGETSITRGPYAAYHTALGTLGMMICYDLDFTDTVWRTAAQGAQLIAVPSFDWPAIADKHYTHLVFRAAENRIAAIKADVGFNSAIIDPYGRILAQAVTPHPEQVILVADVPVGTVNAFATRLGDGVGRLATIAMIGFLVLDLVTAHRTRVAGTDIVCKLKCQRTATI